MDTSKIHHFLMKYALFLGLFFIVEYCLTIAATVNILLPVLALPLKIVTPIALYWIIRRLRDTLLDGELRWFQAWAYGIQLMLFAALIEAAFIYIYNAFIAPDTAYRLIQMELQAFEQLAPLMSQYSPDFPTLLTALKEAPIPSAIDMAVNMISSDLFYGTFLMLIIAPIVRRRGK